MRLSYKQEMTVGSNPTLGTKIMAEEELYIIRRIIDEGYILAAYKSIFDDRYGFAIAELERVGVVAVEKKVRTFTVRLNPIDAIPKEFAEYIVFRLLQV